jgi:hypothetical protein
MKRLNVRNWKVGVLAMVFVAAALMMTVPGASADYAGTFVVNYGPGVYSAYQPNEGYGGEFHAMPSDNLLSLLDNGYDPSTLVYVSGIAKGFDTFCLEVRETFSPGATYNVSFSDYIKWNGYATHPTIALSKGAAWMYHAFQTQELEVLGLYNYGIGRLDSAQEFQYALWALEGEVAAPTAGTNLLYDYVMANVPDYAGANLGYYPVKAVNMWTSTGAPAQDMLVCWVPEPGILLLLGTGMIGLAAFGRKIKRQRKEA